MSTWILGVTGGIGSGKTAATDHFQRLGITVVDADVVSREVVRPGEPALARIAEHFGADMIQPDGTLDRAALRAVVFADPQARRALEAITHPAIRDALATQLAAARSPYAILASPLLFESGQSALVSRTLVIDVPEAVQQERASRRDGVDPAQIAAIMKAQLGRQERLARADDVLDNTGTLAELHAGVEALHARYLARMTP